MDGSLLFASMPTEWWMVKIVSLHKKARKTVITTDLIQAPIRDYVGKENRIKKSMVHMI